MSSKKGKVDPAATTEDDELELEVNNDNDNDDGDQGGSEEPNPHADITLLLKELAEHPDEPYEQIAVEMEIPPEMANKTINDFVKFLIGTHREADFPERMRAHYNSLVRLDRNKLTGKDMMTLMSLINKFHQKIVAAKSTPRERDRLTNKMADMNVPGVQAVQKVMQQTATAPPVQTSTQNTGQSVTFTDASYANQNPQQGQGQQQQGQEQPN